MDRLRIYRPPGVLAIDPGNKQSAFVMIGEGEIPRDIGLVGNDMVLSQLDYLFLCHPNTPLVIEMIACYGMPVGAEVFDTCVWIGRFKERWLMLGGEVEFVYRKDVKMNLCHNMRAKDANIRQALIDRYGGKETAVGVKKSPGPLYGIKKDIWSALAVGLTYLDTRDGRTGEASDTSGREVEV